MKTLDVVAAGIQALPAPVQFNLTAMSLVNVIATLAGYLPAVAAGMSVIWLGLQIWVFFIKKPWKK